MKFRISGQSSHALHGLVDQLRDLRLQIGKLETRLHAWHRKSETSRRLAKVPGIGGLRRPACRGGVDAIDLASTCKARSMPRVMRFDHEPVRPGMGTTCRRSSAPSASRRRCCRVASRNSVTGCLTQECYRRPDVRHVKQREAAAR
jgi:hypothetical protein